ncbi:cyanophycinase [Alteromonas sp. V450]|nr:cyanophycinase [Alteromonas sp. V450]
MKVIFLYTFFNCFKNRLKTLLQLLFFFYVAVFSVFCFASPNLVLAGGALKTCSSMSNQNCTSPSTFSSGKAVILYELNQQSLLRYQELANQYSQNKDFLYSYLVNINSSEGDRLYTKNALLDALNDVGFSDSNIRSLSDTDYFILLDALEAQQVDEQGNRLQEQVSLADTKAGASVDIYTAFIEAAHAKRQAKIAEKENADTTARTIIGIVTASSRDPFEAVDFYKGVFQQPNVEVIWLPLTPAFQQAVYVKELGGQSCNNLAFFRAQHSLFDKERLYPERTSKQRSWCEDNQLAVNTLSRLDGLFFNGGDQSKTLAALSTPTGSPSDFLKTLRERWRDDQLVVGGTSAGTAVQAGGYKNHRPVPMLTSGDSKGVLSGGVYGVNPTSQRCEAGAQCENRLIDGAMTIKPAGGLGLFNWGLLDTHFSERDREARLIAATASSGQSFGFGIDETTALIVDAKAPFEDASFSVVGEGGVFIVDMSYGKEDISHSSKGLKRIIAGEASYLPSGTSGKITSGELKLILEPSEKLTTFKRSERGRWRLESQDLCRSKDTIRWQDSGNTHVLQSSEASRFHNLRYCAYSRVPFVIYE